jgi:hypothetical protein
MGPINNAGANASGTSARQLASDAFRELMVERPGQTAPPEFYDDALRQLQRLTDRWQVDRLTIQGIQRATYPLTANQRTYGIGGNVEQRPVKLTSAAVILSGGTDESRVEITDDRSSISTRGGRFLHCDYAWPTAEVSLSWDPGGDTLVLYSWKPIQQWISLDDVISLAPGYEQALMLALAVQMIPSFVGFCKIPAPLLGDIRENARVAKAAIQRANLRRPEMRSDCDLGGRGSFDYRTGGYR